MAVMAIPVIPSVSVFAFMAPAIAMIIAAVILSPVSPTIPAIGISQHGAGRCADGTADKRPFDRLLAHHGPGGRADGTAPHRGIGLLIRSTCGQSQAQEQDQWQLLHDESP